MRWRLIFCGLFLTANGLRCDPQRETARSSAEGGRFCEPRERGLSCRRSQTFNAIRPILDPASAPRHVDEKQQQSYCD